MKKTTKLKTKDLEERLNLRQGWEIEGIKYATSDPCAENCSNECKNSACKDFWTEEWAGSWGPSSKLINTWLTCSGPQT